MTNETKFNIIIGIFLAAQIDSDTKTELIKFIRRLEEENEKETENEILL